MNWLTRIWSHVFGKKSAAFGTFVPLWHRPGAPLRAPRDYAAFVAEGYKSSVWVYACVREIAASVSAIPWKLQRKVTDGFENISEHPLIDLLERPNPWMSSQEFFEAWATYLNLAGNVYWELSQLDGEGRPQALYLLRPDKIKVRPHPQDFLAGYEYEANQKKVQFLPEEVIHFKFLDPLNEFYGLSPLEAASRIIDTENEAVSWNRFFFQNAAKPDGALMTDQLLSEAQRAALSTSIASDWIGTENAHKPLLLEAGLKWTSLSSSQKDMDFINLRKMAREEICGVFGVPPNLVGILDRATFSNYAQARKSFYEETIVPTLVRLSSKINAELVPRFGDDLYFVFDLTQVSALQEAQDAKFSRLLGTLDSGVLTINEVRTELGYDPVPWGDAWWAPQANIPITGADIPIAKSAEIKGKKKTQLRML